MDQDGEAGGLDGAGRRPVRDVKLPNNRTLQDGDRAPLTMYTSYKKMLFDENRLSLQGRNSAGIKSRIATAGTKYLATSLSPPVV